MDWDNYNEWVEFGRIGAPIFAAFIAGAVALCVLSKNMELGRANLRQAAQDTEKSIQAAEDRKRENWRREQLIEQAAPIFALLREVSILVHATVYGAAEAVPRVRPPTRFLSSTQVDERAYMHELRDRAYAIRDHIDQIELICSPETRKYLNSLHPLVLRYGIDSLELRQEEIHAGDLKKSGLDYEPITQYRIDLSKNLEKIQSEIGNPVRQLTQLLRADMGFEPILTADRTGAQPEPGSPPPGPSPEPQA